MTTLIPTEEQEQAAFVQWLRLKGFPHFRVPNETFTKSFKQKAKNKALGVSAGVPDLFVVIKTPVPIQIVNELGGDAEVEFFNGERFLHRLVAIEMKRTKGGTTSPQQAQWLSTLASAGIEGAVCKGCDAAIKWMEERI